VSRASFNKLKNKVATDYRKKGYSASRARQIGQATAGKVANAKHRKKGK
jgi:hypothetical protein